MFFTPWNNSNESFEASQVGEEESFKAGVANRLKVQVEVRLNSFYQRNYCIKPGRGGGLFISSLHHE